MNKRELEPGIQVVSLNIEGKKHTGRVLDFLRKQRPDVVLLQELFRSDLGRFQNALGTTGVFSPLCRLNLWNDRVEDAEEWGIAILTGLPILAQREDYYKGSRVDIAVNLDNSPASCRALLQVAVQKGNQRFNVANTHFTWGGKPGVTEEQMLDFAKMSEILDDSGEIILAADLNTARGFPIYDSLANRYRDNIPPSVTNTIDHLIRPESVGWNVVSDCLFTSPEYVVSPVQLSWGLSDHCAIGGFIERA